MTLDFEVKTSAAKFFTRKGRKQCKQKLGEHLLCSCLRAQVDPDKAFAVQVAHEEGVLTTSAAYMQCALLYTSSSGERRIRCAASAATRSRCAFSVSGMLCALLCAASSGRCTHAAPLQQL